MTNLVNTDTPKVETWFRKSYMKVHFMWLWRRTCLRLFAILSFTMLKVQGGGAASKTWTRTLNSDFEKPGPRKTQTLKNLDPEKPRD